MAVETYNLTFTNEMSGRPILYNIGKNYDLIVTLKRAQLSESAGWVQVVLQGEPEEIQQAVAELTTQGVFITPTHLPPLVTTSNPMP
jgi:L-aspartate semialdehyde sulfurtransferase ferredoxin